MLTDEDKCDLFRYISGRMRAAESDCTRHQLVTGSTGGILSFIIEHPDICAAELDDFFSAEDEYIKQEFKRLKQKGML